MINNKLQAGAPHCVASHPSPLVSVRQHQWHDQCHALASWVALVSADIIIIECTINIVLN